MTPADWPRAVTNGDDLELCQLREWRELIAQDVRDAEYEAAKCRAMLAWLDAYIRRLERA
ncbi:MAG TPA: hypothetical protein VG845_11585 [Dehalococcoidia bacterium]|nr:hypothetical protein [Dehalococcoidia bacterium]